MKYEGIGFNGAHLAKMSKADFAKEVKHHLSKEQIEELYKLIQAKYNQKKSQEVEPAKESPESLN